MDIEEYIQEIVDKGKQEDMVKLSDILEELLKKLKYYDAICYKKYETELYKMAYGNSLNKKLAKEIVSKMQPYAEKWTLEETKQLQNQYRIDDVNEIDFYVVINSAYNDYNDIFGDNIEMYVRFADDFINDEDAKKDKVFTYFTTIPK